MSDERFISPAPPPSPHERELLEILIEECAEVQQRATKALRFGPTEVQPGQPLTNVQRMSLEVGDLLEVIDMAVGAGLIDREAVLSGKLNKRRQLARFMQTRAATV